MLGADSVGLPVRAHVLEGYGTQRATNVQPRLHDPGSSRGAMVVPDALKRLLDVVAGLLGILGLAPVGRATR
jgi:hypothetical protein